MHFRVLVLGVHGPEGVDGAACCKHDARPAPRVLVHLHTVSASSKPELTSGTIAKDAVPRMVRKLRACKPQDVMMHELQCLQSQGHAFHIS